MAGRYTVPDHIRDYIRGLGYSFPADEMRGYIEEWDGLLRAHGDFWDWSETSNGIRRKVHRLSIHPAARVCDEWASLLLNDETEIGTGDAGCNAWLDEFLASVNFKARAQGAISRAFALGTGAIDVWLDEASGKMQLPQYSAQMILPLSWDDSGITEVGLATRVSYKGRLLDQLKLHVIEDGTYHIRSRCWTPDGEEVQVEGVQEDFDTRGDIPWFAIIRPAIDNTRVDLSPYGQSVYADAADAMRAVDICYDAIFNEVDLAKMRIFISDALIEYETIVREGADGEVRVHKNAIPFGKDNVIFRKVMSTTNDDMIKEYAPSMRTDAQVRAYRTALQAMGDRCGFGLRYFDIDQSGEMKTATQVSSDNSALMRSIRKHENLLQGSIAQLVHAILHCARTFCGEPLSDEGEVAVNFDDSIITDTAAEKAQDMAEVNVVMNPWEYREKWYGEDEATARANVPGGYAAPATEPLG